MDAMAILTTLPVEILVNSIVLLEVGHFEQSDPGGRGRTRRGSHRGHLEFLDFQGVGIITPWRLC